MLKINAVWCRAGYSFSLFMMEQFYASSHSRDVFSLVVHDMLLRRAVSSTRSCSLILWLLRRLLELLFTVLGWGWEGLQSERDSPGHRVWARERYLYLVPHPVRDTAWLDHVRLVPPGASTVGCVLLLLPSLCTATLAITVTNISA